MSTPDLNATIHEFKVLTYVLPMFSIVVTLFRLWDRSRKGRLWWDDFWAFMSMIFFIILVASAELHTEDQSHYTQVTRVALYYMLAEFFYCVNWAAKLSILFTIIRLTVPGPLRRWLVRAGIVFACAWAVLFAQVFWVCEREPGWKDGLEPQCDLGRNVAIAQVITDVVTDAVLVFAPINLVWKIKLSRNQKIRIITVFSATVAATAVSLYHAYAILRFGGYVEARAAIIQDGVSLFVCNFSVVVAFILRITTEDTPTPSGMELKSIIQFKRSGRTTVDTMGISVVTGTTVVADYPEDVEGQHDTNVVKFPDQAEEEVHPFDHGQKAYDATLRFN